MQRRWQSRCMGTDARADAPSNISCAGWALRVSASVLAVFLGLMALALWSCSTSDLGKVGAGSVHVEITSDCVDGVLYAKARDTREGAVSALAAAPIEFTYGQRRYVSIVTYEGYEPERFFLAFRTDPTGEPVVREFDIDDVKDGDIRLRFEADCTTLRNRVGGIVVTV